MSFGRKQEVRRLWREACANTRLGLRTHTPNGWTITVPRIGHITLGDPTSMSVELRPGQMAADVIAVAPRIAYAMGVDSLRVTEMPAQSWLKIERNGADPTTA